MKARMVALGALLFALAVPSGAQAQSANRAPVCSPVSHAVQLATESIPVSCSDPDGDDLSYEAVTQPAHGAITWAPHMNANFAYVDGIGDWRVDRFTFRASDGSAKSADTVAELGWKAPARPVCEVAAAITLRPGRQRSYSAWCHDSSWSVLGYTLLDAADNVTTDSSSFAAYGQATLTGGDAAGTDTMTFKATGPGGDSLPAAQQVVVDPAANTLPSCASNAVTAPPGVTRTLSLWCDDADGDPLAYSLTGSPFTFGSLSALQQPAAAGAPATAKWTVPAATEKRHGSLTFTASDGRGTAPSDGVMSLTADPAAPNEPPECSPFPLEVDRDAPAPATIYPNCWDEDEITYSLVEGSATNGTAAGPFSDGDGRPYFTFDGAARGPASFKFKATDGAATTEATVEITVTAPPLPACTETEPIQVRSGATKQVRAYCYMADSMSMVPGSAEHGTVGSFNSYGSSAYFSFTAEPGFTGEGRVKLRATNAEGTTEMTLRFAISPDVNTKPSCSGSSASVRLGGRRVLTYTCWDDDGDPITVARGSNPAHGTLSNPAGTIASGLHGVAYTAPASTDQPLPLDDDFTLSVDDNRPGGPVSVPFDVTVQPQSFNQAPASCSAYSGSSGGPYSGQPHYLSVQCTDADGDPLSYAIQTPPAVDGATLEGNVTASGYASFTYTAPADYTGPDSFAIEASDGRTTVSIPVSLNVMAPPAPYCTSQPLVRVRPGARKPVTGWCFAGPHPMPGFNVTFEVVDPPEHGTLITGTPTNPLPQPDATWSYTADATDGRGSDTFTDSFRFTATANGQTIGPFTQEIEVTPTADAEPHCWLEQPVSSVLRTSRTVRFTIDCRDEDGDAVQLTTHDPEHGALLDRTVDERGRVHVTYDPDPGFVGRETVRWTAHDGFGPAPGAPTGDHTFTVLSEEQNTAPGCYRSGGVGPRSGGRHAFSFYCSDAEGDPVTIAASGAVNSTIVEIKRLEGYGQQSHAYAVSVLGGTVGDGSFVVTPNDGRTDGTPITEHFDVRPADANYEPNCWLWPPFAISVAGNAAFELAYFGSACFDQDQDPLEFTVAAGPSHGKLTREPDGDFVYTPAANYSGPDEVTFHIDDGYVAQPVVKTLKFLVEPADKPFDTVISDGPPSPSKSGSATFAFSAPDYAGSAFECRRDPAPGDTAAGWAPCASGDAFDGFADGQHVFQVRAVKGELVDPTPAEWTWEVDTTAPAAPAIGGAPAARTRSTDASIAFTGADASVFECKLDGGAYAACVSPKALSGLPDGAHTFSVRAIDAAGNAGPAATHTWTVDTAAPQTTLVSGPSGETAARTARFTFTGGDGFECRLDTGPFAPCTSPHTVSELSEGTHTFEVRALDDVGNADDSPATRSWTVVAEAPAVQTTSGEVPPAGGTVSTAAPGTAPSAEQPIVLALDVPATEAGGAVSIASSASPSGTPPSGYGFVGQQIVIEAPGATAENPLRLTLDVDAATLQAHGLTADTVQVFRDGAAIPACTGPAGHAVPDVCVAERAPLAGGDARLVVLSTHASTWNLGRDTQAPETAIAGGPEGSVTATDATFALTSDDPAASFECSLDGGDFAACAATPSLSGLAPGAHTFRARARDASGNVDGSPATRTWTVVVAPVVTPPAPAGPAAPPTVTAPPAKDTTAPKIALAAPRQRLKAVLAKGLRLSAGCGEPCAVSVSVALDARTAKKLGLGRKAVVAGRATGTGGAVRVKLTRRVAAKLKRVRSVVLTVKAVAADPAGNPAARTIRVTLKR